MWVTGNIDAFNFGNLIILFAVFYVEIVLMCLYVFYPVKPNHNHINTQDS